MFGLLTPFCVSKRPNFKRGGQTLLSGRVSSSDLLPDDANEVALRAERQQRSDVLRRRAAGTDPAKWFWFGRTLGCLLITAVLRIAAGHIDLNHKAPGGENVTGTTHGYHDAEPAVSVEHQLAGMTVSRDGNMWRIQWILLIMMGLMGATVLFEMFRDWLEEVLASYRMVVDQIWSELSVLGFLALCTFVMIQGGLLPAISTYAFGDPHHLVHMFEVLHYMLFFVLLGFLFFVLWLLFALAQVEKEQRSFEAGLAFYRSVAGSGGRTLQSALGLNGKSDPKVVELELATSAAIVESALETAEQEVDQRNRLGRLRGTMDPCDDAAWELLHTQRLVAYQRLRHRFIMAPSSFGRESLPSDFDFSAYLLKCVQNQLADIITLGPDVWRRWMGLVFFICEVGALATELEQEYGCNGLAQLLLISAGWVLLFQACIVQQHYHWVTEQLYPVQSIATAQQEVMRMRARGHMFWRSLYDWLHACMEPAETSEAPKPLPKASKGMLSGIKVIALDGGKGIAKTAISTINTIKDGGVQNKLKGGAREQLSKIKIAGMNEKPAVSYEPGEYLRSGFSLKAGESKHTSLFKLKESIKRPEQIDLYQMKLAAERPAQRWVQQMLLGSSILITINCVFCSPESNWDWKIPLGIFPLVLMMAFQVPSLLEPLVISLSVEMLTDVKAVQDVLYAAKVRRFAHAAKLLQALRSTARMETKAQRDGHRAQTPKNLEELVRMVSAEKQTNLVHLKETFDLFNNDQDATLTPDELRGMLLSTGSSVSPEEVTRMVGEMDNDNDGGISFVEFAWYSLSRDDMSPQVAAEAVFHAIDADGSGVLSVNEIRTAFNNMRSGLDDEELMDIISIFDVGSTGRVERSEFVSKLEEIYKDH